MGSPLYDFVTGSALTDAAALAEGYASLSDHELRDELMEYRDFMVGQADEITRAVQASRGSFSLSGGSRTPPVRHLIQGAFYVERYFADDPLFAYACDVHADSVSAREIFKDGLEGALDRVRLAATVRYLQDVAPMVQYGYLTLVPVNRMNGIADQAIPLNSLVDIFEEPPPEIVQSLVGHARFGIMQQPGSAEPVIRVSFAGDDPGRATVRTTGVLDLNNPLPHGALVRRPSSVFGRAQFQALSTTNSLISDDFKRFAERSAVKRYQQMVGEVRLAETLGASYTTNLPLEFETLAGQLPDPGDTVEHNTADALLYVQLPYLDGIDVQRIMELRNEEPQPFESLRVELESQLRDLRLVTDPRERKIKVENAWHAAAREKVDHVQRKARSQGRIRVRLLVAELAGAILTLNVRRLRAPH